MVNTVSSYIVILRHVNRLCHLSQVELVFLAYILAALAPLLICTLELGLLTLDACSLVDLSVRVSVILGVIYDRDGLLAKN